MALRPIIAICGTTGVGKSNLAVELALSLSQSSTSLGWKGAKIINADSMQVYRGMDIITNKMPIEDRKGVEHLLMAFKEPGEQYTVGEWVEDAIKTIQDTHDKSEIPIVVGGTAYWMQHLIFPNRLASRHRDTQPQSISPEIQTIVDALPSMLKELFENLPTHPPSASVEPEKAFQLHELLSCIDPAVATRWHWRDTRKVLRSLEIVKETGRKPSCIIAEQAGDLTASLPRFETLCFWLWAEQSVLDDRLDSRVDMMIERGLVKEIQALQMLASDQHHAAGQPTSIDYTLGIYQTIGYKEFHRYLNTTDPTDKLFDEAVQRMKLSTRQYARRQVSWLRNKFLPAAHSANRASGSEVVSTYLLDATVLGLKWQECVLNPAVGITKAFLGGSKLVDPLSLSENARALLSVLPKNTSPSEILAARRKLICSTCTTHREQPVMIEEGKEWEAHIRTKTHRKMARRKKEGSLAT